MTKASPPVIRFRTWQTEPKMRNSWGHLLYKPRLYIETGLRAVFHVRVFVKQRVFQFFLEA